MTDAREVRALLDDRPNLEPALESLLETDDNHETWTFDDAGVDSGSFGALVDEGVVAKVDGEYRLADPNAVERALAGEVEGDGGPGLSLSVSLPEVDIDRRVAAALAGALLLVFAFRILPFDAIFREGRVVLSGNDPYRYLFSVEQMTAAASGPFDFSVLDSTTGSSLGGEPLLVAVLWFVTENLGGVNAAPMVTAWYPVVAGLLAACFVYLLATGLTDDSRVGIASVLMLAVMPVLAFRSGLGFADHHAFDYVWLTLTAAALVQLVQQPATRDAVTNRRTLAWTVVAGGAIAGQMLAWNAGPLMLFPLVVYVALAAFVTIREESSPKWRFAPLAGATAIATIVAGSFHITFGWQTGPIVFAPAFLLIGILGIAATTEIVRRGEDLLPASPIHVLAGIEAAGILVVFVLLTEVLPTYGNILFRQLRRISTNEGIVEASSLFATSTFGWLFLFGLLLFLGIPYMGWAFFRATRGEDQYRWLLSGVYASFFLVLAAYQMRFAGELAHFLAVFAGLGFVHIAERVDLARPPIPFSGVQPVRGDGGEHDTGFELPGGRDIAALLFLFLLISGLSIAQAPVKASQITKSDEAFETATWIDAYAEEEGLTYPENYVLTPWGQNRMYNYFVNGQSRSYTFALKNYDSFARATEFDGWYERFSGRVGFIVFVRTDASEQTLYNRLTSAFGSRFDGYEGSGNFRVIHITETHQVHQVVPGANVTGQLASTSGSPENRTVFLRTQTEVSGYANPYVRRTTTDADGQYHVRVAYPGEYEVIRPDSNTTKTITVSEAAVENGEQVDAGTLRTDDTATTSNQTRLRRPAYQVSPS